ncbi:MAG TPA: sialidase family protein, partial [Candidatus Saccharimonadales bacterium]|nr:sialidase family protein [Candidatus Saccharimonadales bacterium]
MEAKRNKIDDLLVRLVMLLFIVLIPSSVLGDGYLEHDMTKFSNHSYYNAYGQQSNFESGNVSIENTKCSNFTEVHNLSNSSVVSTPRISASGNNVFIVWEEGKGGKSNIVYRHSNDSGLTFGPSVFINANNGDENANSSNGSDSGAVTVNSFSIESRDNAIQPDISSSANNVYIVWKSLNSGIQLKHSNDSGLTFGAAITLSNDTSISDLRLAVPSPNSDSNSNSNNNNDNNNVYIVWKNSSIIDNNIYFQKFSGNLQTLGHKILLTNNIGLPVSMPSISASGNNVFIVWEEGKGGKSNIVYRHSNDSGLTFGPLLMLNHQIGL